MDVRAFGSVYGQTATLPYSSGFGFNPNGERVNFPACRAVFIEEDANANKAYLCVELADAPGQEACATNLVGNQVIPISCTAIISGSSPGIFVLY